jgi:putative spermidine/putrescine transport system ATP-binding protein
VVYDVEIAGGAAIKISQARESSAAVLSSGSTIHFAPVSPAACHVFPAQ